MYVEGDIEAGFTSVSSEITLGTLSRLTVDGNPAFLLQQTLSGVPGSSGTGAPHGTVADQFYITALGGFS